MPACLGALYREHDSNLSYEKIFDDLETIVQKMDSGEISLEKSLELFEKGMSLIQEGKDRLIQAEERVNTLINESDNKSKAEK